MSFITRDLIINDEVTMRVSIRDHYVTTQVSLIFTKLINDKYVETRYKVSEPFKKFRQLIEQCKKEGTEVYGD